MLFCDKDLFSVNLFSKTHDSIKKIHLLSKTYDFVKMINLFNKTHDFIQNDKFVNKNDKFANEIWKGIISEKIKKKNVLC